LSTNSYGAKTDTGLERELNEDNYFVNFDMGLYIVADGMGGHQGGEVASAIAVQSIAAAVQAGQPLAASIAETHDVILAAAKNGKGLPGMGTTVVALLMQGCNYEVAWVGDSRAYLYDGNLHPLTRDHTFVQRLIDANALTPEEAKDHPDSSVVTQALGAEDLDAVEVDTLTGRIFAGQYILLCSDGLTSELDDDAIESIVKQGGSEQEIADRLVQSANAQGGGDNITVVLVSPPPEAAAKTSRGGTRPMDTSALNRYIAEEKQQRGDRSIKLWITIGFLMLLILVAIVTGPKFFAKDPGNAEVAEEIGHELLESEERDIQDEEKNDNNAIDTSNDF